MIEDDRLDGGKPFDWGRAAEDYAAYRDIYPAEFFQKIRDAGLCVPGTRVLDLGTGTGVLPRHLYDTGARFVGTDISAEQIEQAKLLAAKGRMDIEFRCAPAEESPFPADSFDTVTACQCFFYFRHEILAPALYRLLKPGGRLAALYMAWLPYEDLIAGESERLVLRYNPAWTGGRETRRPIAVPPDYLPYFQPERREVFDLKVPFTRESWHGRMRACRGIGASLQPGQIAAFDREHRALLEKIAPERFEVRHYAAISVWKSKKQGTL